MLLDNRSLFLFAAGYFFLLLQPKPSLGYPETILMPYPIFENPLVGDRLLLIGSSEANDLARRKNDKMLMDKREREEVEMRRKVMERQRRRMEELRREMGNLVEEEEERKDNVVTRRWIPKQLG